MGVPGVSGQNRLSVEEHRRRGNFAPSRHLRPEPAAPLALSPRERRATLCGCRRESGGRPTRCSGCTRAGTRRACARSGATCSRRRVRPCSSSRSRPVRIRSRCIANCGSRWPCIDRSTCHENETSSRRCLGGYRDGRADVPRGWRSLAAALHVRASLIRLPRRGPVAVAAVRRRVLSLTRGGRWRSPMC
jgi:hypothetical protein